MKTDNASFPRGIIEALFIDEAATAVRIAHYNQDLGHPDRELIQDVVQVDPQSPMYQDLMKLTTLEEIDEDTIEHTKNSINEWKKFEAFQKSLTDEPSIEVPIKIDETDWQLDKLLDTITTNFTKEDLFALKLQVFETEVVKESKDRDKRSFIRKAKTPLEVLSYYHQILKGSV
jgi:hypothetical protein